MSCMKEIEEGIAVNILNDLVDLCDKNIDLATMLGTSPYAQGYIAGLTMLKEHIKDYAGMFKLPDYM